MAPGEYAWAVTYDTNLDEFDEALLNEHILDMKRRGLSKATQDVRRIYVRSLAREAGFSCNREAFEIWLDNKDFALGSRKMVISHIRSFYRWGREHGYLDNDPTFGVVAPKVGRRLPRPLSNKEMNVLLRKAPPRMRAMLLLGALGGLRCMEIAELTAENVRPYGLNQLRIVGKGDRERRIPLHPDLLQALVELPLPESGPLFRIKDGHARTGEPLSPHDVTNEIAAFFHLFQIEGGGHRLRHFFATKVYRSSQDIVLTGELLGHQHVISTQVYAAADMAKAEGIADGVDFGEPTR